MTETPTPKPTTPAELWLLHNGTGYMHGQTSSTETLLAFRSEAAATLAAQRANLTPVRVLPPPDTLGALLRSERWNKQWCIRFSKLMNYGLWEVYYHDPYGGGQTLITYGHPTPEAAVRAALATVN